MYCTARQHDGLRQRGKKKTDHQCVDTRVDVDKHPDRRRHVPHTCPHAHHRPSMVVRLKGRTTSALGDDDQSINDLVEFGEVEEPAPECKTFVPQSSNIRRIGRTLWQQVNKLVLGLPDIQRGVVRDCVADSSWTVNLAERVGDAREAVSRVDPRPDARDCLAHGDERSERKEREENVVQHDKRLEGSRRADPPWLIEVVPSIVRVEEEDRDNVACRDSQRKLPS